MWNVIQSNVVWQKVYYPSIFDKYFKQKIPGVYSCLQGLIFLSVFIQASENGEKKLDDSYWYIQGPSLTE